MAEKCWQGALKRPILFSGSDGENFNKWRATLLAYLDEFGLVYHLSQPFDSSWTVEQVTNHKAIYSYLLHVLSGQAGTLVMADAVKGDCKLAWDALENRFDRRADIDLQYITGLWHRTDKMPNETGTQFIARLDQIADDLAKRGSHKQDDEFVTKIRLSLRSDPRYRFIIEASLVQPNMKSEDLRKIIFELDNMLLLESKYLPGNPASSETHALYSDAAASSSKQKSQRKVGKREIWCFHCGKKGHPDRECLSKKAGNPRTRAGEIAEENHRRKKGLQSQPQPRNPQPSQGAPGAQPNSASSPPVSAFLMVNGAPFANLCQVEGEIDPSPDPVANAVASSSSSIRFTIDSGCSPSFIGSGELCTSLVPSSRTARTADGGAMPIASEGRLPLFGNGSSIPIAVAPTVKTPLLSVMDVCDHCDASVLFEADQVHFVRGKVSLEKYEVLASGHRSGNMYVYDAPLIRSNQSPVAMPVTVDEPIVDDVKPSCCESDDPTPETLSETSRDVEDAARKQKSGKMSRKLERNLNPSIDQLTNTWHERCAHFTSWRRTAKMGVATGFPQDVSKLKLDHSGCKHCLAGKQKQRPYPTHLRDHVKWKVGESYHIDIDYITHPSLGGALYSFTCTDRATGRIFAYPMKTRDEAGARFRHLVAYSERATGNKVQEVVCDNAGEFVGPKSDLGQFLQEAGINVAPSAPYAHNENPYAENANRIVADAARTIRIRARLSKRFWAESYRFASIVHSMLLHKGQSVTAFEAYEKRRPDFANLHVFGCHAFAWIPKEKRHKLDAKSRPAIYLGPAVPGKHGHRLFDPATGEVFVSSSVIFDETSFGIPELLEISKLWRGETVSVREKQQEHRENIIEDARQHNVLESDFEPVRQMPFATNPAPQVATPQMLPSTPSLPNTPLSSSDVPIQRTPVKQTTSRSVTPLRSAGDFDPFESRVPFEPDLGMEDVILKPVPHESPAQSKSKFTPWNEKRNRLRRNAAPPIKLIKDLGHPTVSYCALNCNALIDDGNLIPAKIAAAEQLANSKETPASYRQATTCENASAWRRSMEREINAHSSNKTWNLVPRPSFIPQNASVWTGVNPDNGKKVYLAPPTWQYRIKTAENGAIVNEKSRLCVDGSRITVDNEHTFVSIARPTTIRLIAALAARQGAILSSGDVPSAYVKSKIPDDVEVYVHQPPGFINEDLPDNLCLLSKALYGLPFAGKCWNQDLSKFLIEIGFKQSQADPGTFILRRGSDFMVFASIVDDDIKFSTSHSLYNEVVSKLVAKFDYKDKPTANWFLGMRITQDDERIQFDQADYLQSILENMDQQVRLYNTPGLQSTTLSPRADNDPPATINYPSLCGKLRYLTITRPDIEFALNQCCRFQANPSMDHQNALLRIVGYLKKFPKIALQFPRINTSSPLKIFAFSDASLGDDIMTRRSSFGFMIFIGPYLISWTSRITPNVATSTAESEYIAISETAKELLHIRNVLISLGFEITLPIVIKTDSNNAMSIAKIERINARTKHIDIRYHFIRELIRIGVIELARVSSADNLSDCMTKNVGPNILARFLQGLHKFVQQ